jgi:lipid-binding SYLF domain-containing protein
MTTALATDDRSTALHALDALRALQLGIVGQCGEGVLYQQGGKVAGYYSTAGASVGLQAGAQVYGYVLFFLNEKNLDHVESTEGFEVGVGPSVVLADEASGHRRRLPGRTRSTGAGPPA